MALGPTGTLHPVATDDTPNSPLDKASSSLFTVTDGLKHMTNAAVVQAGGSSCRRSSIVRASPVGLYFGAKSLSGLDAENQESSDTEGD